MKHYLGLEEVAGLLGVKKQNVQMHIRSNTFPEPVMFVGKRSGWAVEQIEDYAKRKGLELDMDKLNELVGANEDEPPKDLPPYYYLGITEAGNLLGWQPAKVSMYFSRGLFPAPVASIGGRNAWSLRQISRYAKESGIELVDVPNENLIEVVIEVPENELWTIAPTYSGGKWIAKKEHIDIKEMPSTFKGQPKTVRRTYKTTYEEQVFDKKDEAITHLLKDSISQNLEHGVTPEFEKELVKLGGLKPVAFRYHEYKVLPKEKAVSLLESTMKNMDEEGIKKIAQAHLELREFDKDKNEWNIIKQHGVCAYDLKKGEVFGYGANADVYPPLQAVIVLYWIDRDTGEVHDMRDSVEEQFAKFY